MTLSIGAWQDMRNHRIKLSLIVMSGAGDRYCDVCILFWMQQSYTGIQDARYLWTWCGADYGYSHGHGCRSRIAVLSRITKEAVGEGDGWFF